MASSKRLNRRNDVHEFLKKEANDIVKRILITGPIFIDVFKTDDRFNYLYPIEQVEQVSKIKQLVDHSQADLDVDILFYHLGISFLATWGNMGRGIGPGNIKDDFQKIAQFMDGFSLDGTLTIPFVQGIEKRLTKWIETRAIITRVSKLMHLARPRLFIPMDEAVRNYLHNRLKPIGRGEITYHSIYLWYLYLVAYIAEKAGTNLLRGIDQNISPLYVIDKHFWIICNIWDGIDGFLKRPKGTEDFTINDTKRIKALERVAVVVKKDPSLHLSWINDVLDASTRPLDEKRELLENLRSSVIP